MDLLDLTGKRALVTGSSRGIGSATGLLLSKLGAEVVFHGSKASIELVNTVLTTRDGVSSLQVADFEKPEQVEKLASELIANDKVPDILVLNASVQSYTGIGNFDAGEFDRMFRANVESSCILLNRLLPEMRKKGSGRVIFVGSINGVRPASRLAVYGATKAALMNIARTAAKENAPYGITVNTILPGVIETDRNAAKLSDAKFADELRENIPMHRFGTVDDCAGVIAFLASDAAAYITGAEIPVDGGWQL